MNRSVFPWIKIDQETANPGKFLGHSQRTAMRYSAVWGSKVLMRPFDELEGFKWGFNLRDLSQEILTRQLGFLETLHSIVKEILVPCRFSLRFVQKGSGHPLSIYLLSRVVSNTEQGAEDLAEQMWLQMQSIFPYDYVLMPLSSGNAFHETEIATPMGSTEIYYPFVGSFRMLSRNFSINNRILLFGNWSTTNARFESVLRSLHQMHQTTMMDVLLQPTITTKHEINQLASALHRISDFATSDNQMTGALASKWQQNLSERSRNLYQVYLLQLRLYSDCDLSLIAGNVTSAFASGPSADGANLPKANVVKLEDNDSSKWVERINNLSYIPLRLPLSPSLRRMPFLSTISEANAVFRLPILPRDGVPNLEIEYSEPCTKEISNVL